MYPKVLLEFYSFIYSVLYQLAVSHSLPLPLPLSLFLKTHIVCAAFSIFLFFHFCFICAHICVIYIITNPTASSSISLSQSLSVHKRKVHFDSLATFFGALGLPLSSVAPLLLTTYSCVANVDAGAAACLRLSLARLLPLFTCSLLVVNCFYTTPSQLLPLATCAQSSVPLSVCMCV